MSQTSYKLHRVPEYVSQCPVCTARRSQHLLCSSVIPFSNTCGHLMLAWCAVSTYSVGSDGFQYHKPQFRSKGYTFC